jgi:hypothetical protein
MFHSCKELRTVPLLQVTRDMFHSCKELRTVKLLQVTRDTCKELRTVPLLRVTAGTFHSKGPLPTAHHSQFDTVLLPARGSSVLILQGLPCPNGCNHGTSGTVGTMCIESRPFQPTSFAKDRELTLLLHYTDRIEKTSPTILRCGGNVFNRLLCSDGTRWADISTDAHFIRGGRHRKWLVQQFWYFLHSFPRKCVYRAVVMERKVTRSKAHSNREGLWSKQFKLAQFSWHAKLYKHWSRQSNINGCNTDTHRMEIVFRNVTPCDSFKNRRFGRTSLLHHQGTRIGCYLLLTLFLFYRLLHPKRRFL